MDLRTALQTGFCPTLAAAACLRMPTKPKAHHAGEVALHGIELRGRQKTFAKRRHSGIDERMLERAAAQPAKATGAESHIGPMLADVHGQSQLSAAKRISEPRTPGTQSGRLSYAAAAAYVFWRRHSIRRRAAARLPRLLVSNFRPRLLRNVNLLRLTLLRLT